MTPATQQVLTKLLQSMRALIDTALSLLVNEEPEAPAPEKPRFLGDTDGGQGPAHQ